MVISPAPQPPQPASTVLPGDETEPAPLDALASSTAAPPQRPPRPDARFMLRHPAHWVAMGFGSGLSPVAPGTVGTLWGWVAFLVFDAWVRPLGWGPVLILGLLWGWWACTVTATHAGVTDPGFIVWDEILAFWLVLWLLMPAPLWLQALAFALFRYFDAAKPGPVRWADQRFKGGGWRGGFGILFDDGVAALCTLLVLAGLLKIWPDLRG